MPGLDRKINPLTKGYIDDGAGGYEETTDLSPAMHHQLNGHRNKWPGDPEAGSFIYTLIERNLDATTLELAQQFVSQALQPFVDTGEARDLETEARAHPDLPTQLLLGGRITDIQAGEVDLATLLGAS